MPNRPLDRSNFMPLYQQLVERMKMLIEQQWDAGDLIPSETELMARYDVSRNTVRQAIGKLAQDGFVIRVQGKGTYVAPERNRYRLQKLVSFTEDMSRRGLKASTQLLGLKCIQPSERVAQALNLADGEQVYELRRLRLADGEPMAVSTTYLPCGLLPGLNEEVISRESLFSFIRSRLPQSLGYSERIIRPAVADEELSKQLQVATGFPLMQIEGTVYLEDDRPIEFSKIFYRGDRYEFFYRAYR